MKLRHLNDAFLCASCGAAVPPRRPSDAGPGGLRNHCPRCLASLHVDELLPGDRASGCHGVMEPVGLRTRHGELQVLQRCRACRRQHWNVVAPDDDRRALETLPAA